MSSTEADSAAATASDPGGVASSAPENISSGALAATASTSPADPDPATVDQSNPYVLALLGIRHDATTEDARAVGSHLRATCFARVDNTLYLTFEAQFGYHAAWSCSRHEVFRDRVGDASRPFSAIGIGTISEAFTPRDVDLLSQKLQAVDLPHPGPAAGDASSA